MAISPCIFNINWPKKDQSWGGTSHWSSGFISLFLESVEQGEWEKHSAKFNVEGTMTEYKIIELQIMCHI